MRGTIFLFLTHEARPKPTGGHRRRSCDCVFRYISDRLANHACHLCDEIRPFPSTTVKTARKKGHDFEREIAQQFRELGWEDAMTTRAARGGDWSHTDDGIDLVNTEPFAVQCKRLQGYASVNTIEEIHTGQKCQDFYADGRPVTCFDKIPLLLTKANGKPTMAVLPWDELKKLLKDYHA